MTHKNCSLCKVGYKKWIYTVTHPWVCEFEEVTDNDKICKDDILCHYLPRFNKWVECKE